MGQSTIPDDTPPGGAAPGAPPTLPAPLTSLVGRDDAVAALCALLREPDARLVTLTGPAGIGKTRLALAVAAALANDYPDGVRAVSLAALTDPALVLPAIALALGAHQAGGRPALERLRLYLRERTTLLLLDNFEQVATAAPPLVALLQSCPSLRLLVTSRTALHVSGEHGFPVSPLAIPPLADGTPPARLARVPAVDLFMRRARAIRADFALTPANAATIAEICVRLDGLPLAIELAAARINVLTPHALLARLEHQLVVLVGGPADAPRRQRTLRNALAWSYDLLDDDEQWRFRQLGVFAGGCSLSAIAAVYAREEPTDAVLLARLGSLLDKSLMQRDSAPDLDDATAEPRFRLLEPLRQFADERLHAAGEADAARQAHAAHYHAFAIAAEPQLYATEQVQWFARVERDHDNLRAALGWLMAQGDGERAGALCAALVRFWAVRGHVTEGRRWLERALALDLASAPAVRARLLSGAGWLALRQNDLDRAAELCAASLVLCRALGNDAGAGLALHRLGLVAESRGQLAESRALLEESQACFAAAGDRGWQAYALMSLGGSLSAAGDLPTAEDLLRQGLALFRQTGNTEGSAWSLLLLARARAAAHDAERASALAAECVPLFRALGLKEGVAAALALQGRLSLRLHDLASARVIIAEAVRLARELGDDDRLGAVLALAAEIEAAPTPTPLTAREIEVLRLVASGLTDAQVAATLVVSARTVNAHLRSIYGKLEVTSRAAATRAALERHLI